MWVYILYYTMAWMQGDSLMTEPYKKEIDNRDFAFMLYEYGIRETKRDLVIRKEKRIIEIRIDSVKHTIQ